MNKIQKISWSLFIIIIVGFVLYGTLYVFDNKNIFLSLSTSAIGIIVSIFFIFELIDTLTTNNPIVYRLFNDIFKSIRKKITKISLWYKKNISLKELNDVFKWEPFNLWDNSSYYLKILDPFDEEDWDEKDYETNENKKRQTGQDDPWNHDIPSTYTFFM